MRWWVRERRTLEQDPLTTFLSLKGSWYSILTILLPVSTGSCGPSATTTGSFRHGTGSTLVSTYTSWTHAGAAALESTSILILEESRFLVPTSLLRFPSMVANGIQFGAQVNSGFRGVSKTVPGSHYFGNQFHWNPPSFSVSQTIFPSGDLIRCPSELRCLTRVKRAHPLRSLGWLMVDSHGVSFWARSTFSVPVPVPVPVPWIQVRSSSTRRVRFHRSDSILLHKSMVSDSILDRDWLLQLAAVPVPVPGSKSVPVPQDESDPIDPTWSYFISLRFQTPYWTETDSVGGSSSSSSSSSSRIQVRSRFSHTSPIPSIRHGSTF